MEIWFSKTHEEITNVLLNTWKIDSLTLVGTYKRKKDASHGSFVNVRTIDYVALSFPQVEGLENEPLWVFTNHYDGLIMEEQYIFNAVLQSLKHRKEKNNPFLLKADNSIPAKLFRPSPKQFIQRRYQIIGQTPLLTEDQLSKSIETIKSEINKKPETFIYELLQNADDYPARVSGKAQPVQVSFQVTDECLLLTHTGEPFKVNNVHALCGVNEKDKADDQEKIGFKGIGFKSVFKDCDYVFVNSGGYRFRFDKRHHLTKTFWETIPIWTERQETPASKIEEFWKAPVGFILKPRDKGTLDDDQVGYIKTLNTVFDNPRLLLFLRYVEQVRVKTEVGEFVCKKDFEKWWVKKYAIAIPQETSQLLNDGIRSENKRDTRIPEKYLNLRESNISFATLRQNNEIDSTPDATLFVYLPTRINLGFPFIVNGDFIPDGSREMLHDMQWNRFLMRQTGKQFTTWLKDIGNYPYKDSTDRYFKKNYLDTLIPDFDECLVKTNKDLHWLIEAFRDGFVETLNSTAFIPDQMGELQKIQDILIDETGLYNLLGREFAALTGIDQIPVHSLLAHSRVLMKLVAAHDGCIFGREQLHGLIKTEIFSSWLKNPINNASFLKLLHEKHWLDRFKDQSIFLNQQNELQTADGLWLDLGDDLPLLNWMPMAYLHPAVRQQMNRFELPVAQYTPVEFIAKAILTNQSVVDDLLDQKVNNLSFYRYLFKHRSQLTDQNFSTDKLSWFRVWGKQGDEEYISSFQNNQNLYTHHLELRHLLESRAFPKDHFYLLSPDFAETPEQQPEWDNFWYRFKVKPYSAASFLQDEIVNQITKLNAYSGSYTAFGNEPSEEYIQIQQGNISLWQFINSSLQKLPADEKKSTQQKLSTLAVFVANECQPKPLKDCYLSEIYTGNDAVEMLVKEYGLTNIHFVSDLYQNQAGVEWKKLFGQCGVKTDTSDIVKSYVLPNLGNLSDAQQIVSYTRLIINEYTNLKNDSAVIANLRNFLKCKTAEGSLVTMREALIGSHYESNMLIDSILPSVKLPNQISEEYTTSNKAKWVEFFKALGATSPTEPDIINRKIDHLLANQSTYNTSETTVSRVSELLALHQQKKLTESHLKKLMELQLLVSSEDNTMLAASQCHLPSVLKPDLDLEKLLGREIAGEIFVENGYYSGNDSSAKKFLTDIGVRENFSISQIRHAKRNDLPMDYLTYLENLHTHIKTDAVSWSINHSLDSYLTITYSQHLLNYNVAKKFWQNFDKAAYQIEIVKSTVYRCGNRAFNVPTYAAFSLQNKAIIPTESGVCAKAKDLFSVQHKELIDDPALTPAVDLRNIKVDNKTLEEWLGIRQTVPLHYYFRRISQVHDLDSLKAEGIWDKVAYILNGTSQILEEADKNALNDFKANGTLPNQSSEWHPVKNLYIITDDFGLGIGKWKQLIHEGLAKLAEKLGVSPLTKADFEFFPEKPYQDWKLKYEVNSRLKFIAFAEDDTCWQELEQEYSQRLGGFTFYQTDEILFNCNKVTGLTSTEADFHENGTEIYYLGSWNEPRAGKLLEFLYRKLDLKKTSQKQFNDFLFGTEKKIIDLFEQRNLTIPDEWRPKLPVSPPIQQIEPKSVVAPKAKINPIGLSEQEDETELEETFSPISSFAEKSAISAGLSPEEQKQRNKEAREVLIDWLENHPDYDCSDIELDDYQIDNVRERAGEKHLTFFVSSAVKGTLYVWPARWLAFDQPNTRWALVVNDRVKEVFRNQQELLSRYSRTLLRVYNDCPPALEDLNAVAEITEYSKTWQFMFYDPRDDYYSTPRKQRVHSDTGTVDVTTAEDDILDD